VAFEGVDPLFNWLQENGKIIGERGEVWEVECPKGCDHSDGDIRGIFSPWGEGEDENQRWFYCHHEHDGKKPGWSEFIKACIEGGYGNDACKMYVKKDGLVENFVYIKNIGKYYEISKNCLLSKEAINASNRIDFPGGRGDVPVISTWLELQPEFRKVEGLFWMPIPYESEEYQFITLDNQDMVNTWTGFAVHPKQGNVQPWLDLLEHLVPEKEYQEHVIAWCAFMVQTPHKKCNWQIVMSGIEGAGKDSLFAPLCAIFGRAGRAISGRDIKSDYDDGFAKAKLVLVEEAENIRGGAVESLKMKCASTGDDWQMLNIKKEAKISQMNCWAIAILTNNIDALKLRISERRFFVLHAPEVLSVQQACAFYEGWLHQEGARYLFDYLLNYDLEDFNPDVLPCRTQYFQKMFNATRADWEAVLADWVAIWEEEESIKIDAVLPELLRTELRKNGIECSKRVIENWFIEKGYSETSDRITKVNNKKKDVKSTNWLFKNYTEYKGNGSRQDVFDKISAVEQLFELKFQ
jgi:hypothetical protein